MDEKSSKRALLSRNENSKQQSPNFLISSTKWIVKVSIWVIFIAWASLIFLYPSDTVHHFYLNLLRTMETPLFGIAGTVFLLYSAPILFIAFLATAYIYLRDDNEIQGMKSSKHPPRVRLWTLPILVDGPFGVVSAAEVIGIAIFMAYIVWSMYAETLKNIEVLAFFQLPSKEQSDIEDEAVMEWLMDDTEDRMLLEHLERKYSSRKRRYVHRDREGAHDRLMKDYFVENPTWGPNIFRRRFRMRKELFTRIVDALESYDEYFHWRVDATGKRGFSPLQKCTVAIRQLAYGGPADHYDEYLRVAETTAIECLTNFCRCVIEVFGEYYLRKPNAADCQRLIQMHEICHGFPGMLGSLDCMHWEWKNCPVAWKGQFTRGDHGVPTIMLEAVASSDLWIWHAFFGVAGSNNDINVLNQSPLFNDVLQGRAPNINFIINDKQFTQGYYLTDGIYPDWATFVKSFQCPQDPKRKKFKEMQEAARKDVERAFGVLQARWAMIRGPSRLWYRNNLKDIMLACIILHNMIIEDEGNAASDWTDESNVTESSNNNNPQIVQGSVSAFNEYITRGSQLRDKERHRELRAALIEHVWARYGNN